MFQNFKNKLFNCYIRLVKKTISIGKGSTIQYNTYINVGSNRLEIGDNVYVRSNPKGYHAGMPFTSAFFIDIKGAYIKIGNNTRLNGVFIHSQAGIDIGNDCVIASGVQIIDSNGHKVNSINRTIDRDNPIPIKIGNNVWIGLNSIILKGSVIGDNSVVAAGSIVKGIFPNNVLISGNMAKVVGKIKCDNNEDSRT
ncbi:MAG: acyltransferase [Ignavibacteriae bacterium]|nr:acyltransferase [Ignavibacteriota bacterium]